MKIYGDDIDDFVGTNSDYSIHRLAVEQTSWTRDKNRIQFPPCPMQLCPVLVLGARSATWAFSKGAQSESNGQSCLVNLAWAAANDG